MKCKVSHGSIYGIAGNEAVTPQELVPLCNKIVKNLGKVRSLNGNIDVSNLKDIHNYWPQYNLVLDCRKIKNELGINFTPINIGVKNTLKWINNEREYTKQYYKNKKNTTYARKIFNTWCKFLNSAKEYI